MERKIKEIDGLRAIAVILVLMEHWGLSFGLPLGMIGVTIFFVISGFLISQILLNEKANERPFLESLKVFFARRFLRIFPVYYLVLLLLFLTATYQFPKDYAFHIFYLSNVQMFYSSDWSNYPVHFWTLCVEEQFYLFWPLVLFVCPDKWLLKLFVILLMASLLFDVAFMFGENLYAYRYQILLPSVIDSFCFGATIAILKRTDGLNKLPFNLAYPIIGLIVLTLIGNNLNEITNQGIQRFVAGTASFLLLVFIIRPANQSSMVSRLLSSKVLTEIGRLSYAIYLFHLFIPSIYHTLHLWAIDSNLTIPFTELILFPEFGTPLYNFVIYFILTLLLSFVSWHLIESPALKLKNKFPYKAHV